MYKRRESTHTPVDGYDPVAPTVTTRACHLLFVPQTYILRAPGMQAAEAGPVMHALLAALAAAHKSDRAAKRQRRR